ncbi:MAG: LysR family transcriptional regulator [Betaproteobacteria bacterium]|nr:LysR family transcriptional regulator [Betaproteobacteria bacterium]
MKNASMRQLRVLVAVARHASVSRAAEELHLTPPAVSMQLKELETDIGLPLFDRIGRTVSLTMVGEHLLVYAQRILATLREADSAVARLRGLASGTLVIGMVSTAKYFLPRLLARFREEHPGVELRLSLGNREALVRQLQGNEVDLAVMGRPPRELDTRAEPFAAHPHAVVAGAQHRLAQVEEIPPSALAGEGFIVREEGSGTRAAMEQFFREHSLRPPVVMEMGSNETIKQAVIANMGLSFLSLHTLGLELERDLLRVVPVDGLPLVRRWHIVNMRGRTLSPAAEAFRYFILERAEAFLAQLFPAEVLVSPSATSMGR